MEYPQKADKNLRYVVQISVGLTFYLTFPFSTLEIVGADV